MEAHEPMALDPERGWVSTAPLDETLVAGASFGCVDREGRRARLVLYHPKLESEPSFDWVPLGSRAGNRGLARVLHCGWFGECRYVITESLEHRRLDRVLPVERALSYVRDVASALLAAENHAMAFPELSLADLAWTSDDRLVIADPVSLREDRSRPGVSHLAALAPVAVELLAGAAPSRELQSWMLRCLGLDSEQRYTSVRDAYRALPGALPALDEIGTRSTKLEVQEETRVLAWESAIGDWVYDDVSVVKIATAAMPSCDFCSSWSATVRWIAPAGSTVPAGGVLAVLGLAE